MSQHVYVKNEEITCSKIWGWEPSGLDTNASWDPVKLFHSYQQSLWVAKANDSWVLNVKVRKREICEWQARMSFLLQNSCAPNSEDSTFQSPQRPKDLHLKIFKEYYPPLPAALQTPPARWSSLSWTLSGILKGRLVFIWTSKRMARRRCRASVHHLGLWIWWVVLCSGEWQHTSYTLFLKA